MNGNNQLTEVEDNVAVKIGFFNGKNVTNRRMALIFTLAPAILSAIATVSIGVSERLSVKWFIIIALIASASATVLGAWEALFSNRKMWIVAGIALAELAELQSDINYRKKNAAAITQAETDDYHERLKKISQKAENSWQSVMSKS